MSVRGLSRGSSRFVPEFFRVMRFRVMLAGPCRRRRQGPARYRTMQNAARTDTNRKANRFLIRVATQVRLTAWRRKRSPRRRPRNEPAHPDTGRHEPTRSILANYCNFCVHQIRSGSSVLGPGTPTQDPLDSVWGRELPGRAAKFQTGPGRY